MVDFQFNNGAGVLFTIRTDANSLTDNACTILDIQGATTDTELGLIKHEFFVPKVCLLADFAAFATLNTLTLNGFVRGGSAAAVTIVA